MRGSKEMKVVTVRDRKEKNDKHGNKCKHNFITN